MLAQRKGTKRKGTPEACPLARVRCASRENRRSPNSRSRWRSIRSDMASLAPVFPAMLGCAYGVWAITLDPVGRAEYRSRSGEKARILSEADLTRSAELCAPPERRGTHGKSRPAGFVGTSADAASGCPSLWVLSLGHARPICQEQIGTSAGWPEGRSPGRDFAKSTSPARAKPDQGKPPVNKQ